MDYALYQPQLYSSEERKTSCLVYFLVKESQPVCTAFTLDLSPNALSLDITENVRHVDK